MSGSCKGTGARLPFFGFLSSRKIISCCGGEIGILMFFYLDFWIGCFGGTRRSDWCARWDRVDWWSLCVRGLCGNLCRAIIWLVVPVRCGAMESGKIPMFWGRGSVFGACCLFLRGTMCRVKDCQSWISSSILMPSSFSSWLRVSHWLGNQARTWNWLGWRIWCQFQVERWGFVSRGFEISELI